MINFQRTVNSFNMGWLLIHTEDAALFESAGVGQTEAAQSVHVTVRRFSGAYHIRNSSAGTAAPVTVENVSIPKYGPLSNDDSDDAAMALALLRGVSWRDCTLGCCGG